MASPQAQAKQAAMAIIEAARSAGWTRARLEVKPDGSYSIDTQMGGSDDDDDFLSGDLRMGGK